jgi:photosystem II stability/assembly factor-like uncharacterized protein
MRFLTLLCIVGCISAFAQKNEPQKDKKENTNDKPKEVKENKFQSAINGLSFRSIGPALTSGRIADFAVNPNNVHHYYVASASGGVWRTTNGGASYEPIFDNQGSFSIGCVTLSPVNPDIVWVGTGENHNQRSVSYGDGVYKSEDGGNTWTNMGLKNSEHIAKIIIHPNNPNIVYVAAYGPLWSAGGERGVYKTTDGGKTWKQVLNISENTGVSDLAIDPTNPDVLYACAHQRRRHVFTLIDGGPESAVYKTTNGGETWDKLTNGLPSGDIGRIAIAVSPVNPLYVYLQIEAEGDKGGVFRSTNAGGSFNKMSGYYTSGNYFQEIFCDPVEINRIYAVDVYMQVSDDGGKTWKPLGERFKHVDNHALWINPKNNKHYLAGCDGGIYESFDKGKTWLFKPNLPVTQFYRVDVDNSLPFYYVYGGTQDNFSLGGPSGTTNINGIANSDWFITHGGDGFVSRIDPNDPNIVYAESQYAGLVRYDRKSGEEVPIQPIEGKGEKALRWNWDSPLIISPHASTRLYFAANKVFRSEDRGNSWTCISEDLTQQIDRNKLPVMGKVWSIDAVAKSQSTSFYGNIVSLQESPKKENLLYIGTDDGLIQVSEDAKTWKKIDNFPNVPKNTYVSAILASQHDENVVYAAFNNHKNGDFKPYLLKSTDKGKSWTSIASNLPERGSVHCIAEDFINRDLLFVGTEFGIFVSLNGGKEWIQMKGGLPTIAVRDIAIQKRENDLVIATFGRGFYILDNYTPLRNLSDEIINKEAYLFAVKNALLYVPSRPIGLREKGFLGESHFIAPNPAFGAVFTYYLKESLKTLKEQRQEKEQELEKQKKDIPYPTFEEMRAEDNEPKPYLVFVVKNEKGEVVRRLKTDASKGLKRIVWDLRYATTSATSLTPQDLSDPFAEPDLGHFVTPGTYSVQLYKVVQEVATAITDVQTFKVTPLNNATLVAQDKEKVHAFQQQVAELKRQVDILTPFSNDINNRIKHLKTAILNTPKADMQWLAQLENLQKTHNTLRVSLFGDASLARRNFETPPSVAGRIEGALYSTWFNTQEPTQTQIQSFNIAKEEFEQISVKMKELDNQLKQIESQMESSKAPWTPNRMPSHDR